MSVVSLVLCDNFALIMGDTKLNDNPNRQRISKVFKKEDTLLGYTGRLKDVKEYLYPIFTDNMQLNENFIWNTENNPLEFIRYLDNLFYNAKEQNNYYDIIFVVAVKIDNKYIAKKYCLFSPEHPQWENDFIDSSDGFQCFYLGKTVHFDYFQDLLMQSTLSTHTDIITIFQKTLNYGIKHDDTINNKMEWFTI